MYAANAGKSGGEFFTPQEVSELLAKLTLVGKSEVNKVYDPACGSGSLLLKFAKVLGKENVRNGFFGQEINLTTYNLCRINMFLHDINYEKFDIALGDTLTKPCPRHITNEPFEAIVSNPPYSTNWDGDANPILINDDRYTPAGVLAPKSKADFAFVMHILSWLATNGTAAIVSFPGAMYRSGKEQKIRKYLVDNNYIDAVIQLPTELFYGTTIGTCIVVLRKNKTDNKFLFIDASQEFIRGEAKNKLSQTNINNILKNYISRKTNRNFSRLVTKSEIVKNNYDTSVKKYFNKIENTHSESAVSLDGRINKCVTRQNELRDAIGDIIASIGNKIIELGNTPIAGELRGVLQTKLGVVCKIKSGENVNKRFISQNTGDYPVVNSGREPLGYIDKWNTDNDPIGIASRGSVGLISWTEGKYYRGNLNYSCTINDRDLLLDRYLYFLLKAMQPEIQALCTHDGIPALNKCNLEKLEIKIPSMSIQRKVVSLLDEYTICNNDLTKELNVEVNERTKQYEYFRTNLLAS